jgi:formylglycine-generating enzyme required for sulfatase activity
MSVRAVSFVQLLLFLATVWSADAAAEADLQRGQALAASCMGCHSVEGLKADMRFSTPRLGRQKSKYLLRALRAYKDGSRSSAIMQAQVGPLSDEDLQNLAAYWGYFPKDNAEFKNELRSLPLARGAGIVPQEVVETCGGCHGESGGGVVQEVPVLAGQYADYIDYALNQYKSGVRKQVPWMTSVTQQLTEPEIRTLAEYFSGETAMPFALKSSEPVIGGPPEARAPTTSTPQARPETVAAAIAGIAMIDLPASHFVMGADESQGFSAGSPPHVVRIRAFRMGKYEVTFDQYDAFARDTGRELPDDEGWGRGSRPVINVTWADTQAFIDWLKRKSKRRFRLPSEAEWEYAARGGTNTAFWWGDQLNPELVNADGINGKDQWLYTAPVGQFPPNPFGLYDVAGNVYERVADCWHTRYDKAPGDGGAWVGAPCYGRVIRGGSWDSFKRPLMSAGRSAMAEPVASESIGFRLAEDLPGK